MFASGWFWVGLICCWGLWYTTILLIFGGVVTFVWVWVFARSGLFCCVVLTFVFSGV